MGFPLYSFPLLILRALMVLYKLNSVNLISLFTVFFLGVITDLCANDFTSSNSCGWSIFR